MGNSFFRFKEFTVLQDRCAMKVSTDAVILGAVASGRLPVKRILDVGTGTGVLALMLAQRYQDAFVTAVEIDSRASDQAIDNVASSPWKNRISVINADFRHFCLTGIEQYDLIVSNPPYYSNHLLSADSGKNHALHQGSLSFLELAAGSYRLLVDGGVFWIILPPRQMEEFEQLAARVGFFGLAKVAVYDRQGKPLLRVVRGFSNRKPVESSMDSTLLIKNPSGEYSNSYRQLLKAFLLHF